jgi:hypothetical protein
MSVGDLHAIAPSDTSQANATKLNVAERTPRRDQSISDSHGVRQDFNQLNSDDVSFLLNGQGALAGIGVGQTGSQESSSTSKEEKLE